MAMTTATVLLVRMPQLLEIGFLLCLNLRLWPRYASGHYLFFSSSVFLSFSSLVLLSSSATTTSVATPMAGETDNYDNDGYGDYGATGNAGCAANSLGDDYLRHRQRRLLWSLGSWGILLSCVLLGFGVHVCLRLLLAGLRHLDSWFCIRHLWLWSCDFFWLFV